MPERTELAGSRIDSGADGMWVGCDAQLCTCMNRCGAVPRSSHDVRSIPPAARSPSQLHTLRVCQGDSAAMHAVIVYE